MKKLIVSLLWIMALNIVAHGDTLTNYIYVYSTTNVVTTINSNLYDASIATLDASNRFNISLSSTGMRVLAAPSAHTNGVPIYNETNTYYGIIHTDMANYQEYRQITASNKWANYPAYEYFTGITLYPNYISIVLTQKTGSSVLILPQSRLKRIEVRDTTAVTFPYE
jgi:hypothetical protein